MFTASVQRPAPGVDPVFDISDHLRKAREHAGISREEMAELIGVSPRSITRYENTPTAVPKSVVLSYALSTGVRAAWIDPVRCTPRDLNPEPTVSGTILPFRGRAA